MRVLILLLACLFSTAANAADPAPVMAPTAPVAPTVAPAATPKIGIPAPHNGFQHGSRLTPADRAAAAARVPAIKKQLDGLSVDQQRLALRQSAPPRQKLTDAERQGRAAATRANWAAKTPEERAALRARTGEAWGKLPAEDKAYRRERMAEQLRSLPEADRTAIIQAATAK